MLEYVLKIEYTIVATVIPQSFVYGNARMFIIQIFGIYAGFGGNNEITTVSNAVSILILYGATHWRIIPEQIFISHYADSVTNMNP